MTYTESELIDILRKVASRTDGSLSVPNYKKLKDPDDPASRTFHARMGSWNQAKEKAELEKLEKGEHTPARKSVNQDYFKNLDEESAYWLGFIYADGYVDVDIPQFSLKITESDRHHLEKFRSDIEAEHKISVDTSSPNGCDGAARVILSNYQKKFIEPLVERGLRGDKTHNGSLPAMEQDLWPHFFRGLYDGDGTWMKGYEEVKISGNVIRFKNLQEFVPADAKIVESKTKETKKHGSMAFRSNSAINVLDWMYPEGEETEPKLDRKLPDWY